MGMYGANADGLEAAAKVLEAEARNLEKLIRTIGSQVNAAPWYGQSADKFRSDWSSTRSKQLRAAAGFLDLGGDTLVRNAREQRAAANSYDGSAVASIARGRVARNPFLTTPWVGHGAPIWWGPRGIDFSLLRRALDGVMSLGDFFASINGVFGIMDDGAALVRFMSGAKIAGSGANFFAWFGLAAGVYDLFLVDDGYGKGHEFKGVERAMDVLTIGGAIAGLVAGSIVGAPLAVVLGVGLVIGGTVMAVDAGMEWWTSGGREDVRALQRSVANGVSSAGRAVAHGASNAAQAVQSAGAAVTDGAKKAVNKVGDAVEDAAKFVTNPLKGLKIGWP